MLILHGGIVDRFKKYTLKNNFIYLFLTVGSSLLLGLFSSWGGAGATQVVVRGLLLLWSMGPVACRIQ